MYMSEISKETVAEIIKRIDENVSEIKVQTTTTNGNVSNLQKWQYKTKGALVIIKLLFIPIILALIISFIK